MRTIQWCHFTVWVPRKLSLLTVPGGVDDRPGRGTPGWEGPAWAQVPRELGQGNKSRKTQASEQANVPESKSRKVRSGMNSKG